jgi:hypothetical protein
MERQDKVLTQDQTSGDEAANISEERNLIMTSATRIVIR